MARLTGLEPATPGVTGRYSNQLSYNRPLSARTLARTPASIMVPPAQGQAVFCRISRDLPITRQRGPNPVGCRPLAGSEPAEKLKTTLSDQSSGCAGHNAISTRQPGTGCCQGGKRGVTPVIAETDADPTTQY